MSWDFYKLTIVSDFYLEIMGSAKKERTGEGIMLFQKWKNFVGKKDNIKKKDKKKKKDRLRYLLKKEAISSLSQQEKKEKNNLKKHK